MKWLDKVFRKRKAQGAIEYVFMVAAALVIILVVVRYVLRTGQETIQIANETTQNITELLRNATNS